MKNSIVSAMRRSTRLFVVALVMGLFMVGGAWAGIGLAPVPVSTTGGAHANVTTTKGHTSTKPIAGVKLAGDEVLVGAAKIDIRPNPDASKGEVWEHDAGKCDTEGNPQAGVDNAGDAKSPWPENPNCIYAGGFGVGPSQPLIDFDEDFGLWTRSVAFLDGNGKAIVLTILDAEGYFSRYNKMCPPEKACGSFDLAEQLGEEFHLDPSSFVFASTHSHAAPDFIGGWGGVPVWYMRQVAESMRESVREAINGAQPATLEAGEVVAHRFNNERRDTYYSAEDPTLNWLRATGRDGSTVATVGTFAAHPTSFGSSWNIANADWPVQFDKTVENRFGGVAAVFQAGLGNMSARDNNHGSMGIGLAGLVPDAGQGTPVASPTIAIEQERWDQPVTNVPLGTLGAAGLFDHPFSGPAAVTAGKSADKPCASAGPDSAHVAATAARIGGVYITAAPGEIFANFSNTIEERAPITALAIGQANDALGYMPQSFEFDIPTQQGPGFAQPTGPNDGDYFEYEEAYSIDRCFGDRTLDAQLRMLAEITK